MTIDEDNHPELLRVVRSSYGLMGIAYEVTYRVRPLQLIMLWHRTYTLDQFLSNLDDIRASGTSVMMYYYPYEDMVTVEFRVYHNNQAVNASEPNLLLADNPFSLWTSLPYKNPQRLVGRHGPQVRAPLQPRRRLARLGEKRHGFRFQLLSGPQRAVPQRRHEPPARPDALVPRGHSARPEDCVLPLFLPCRKIPQCRAGLLRLLSGLPEKDGLEDQPASRGVSPVPRSQLPAFPLHTR